MLPDADDAKKEADHSPGYGGKAGSEAQTQQQDHEDRAGQSGSGVDVRLQHAGRTGEKKVADGAAAYRGDRAQQNRDKRVQFVKQGFLGACNGEEAETRGVQNHDEVWGNSLNEMVQKENDGTACEGQCGVAPVS